MPLDPKALRAQAKHLLELARAIEAMENPEKHVQKIVNRKVAGVKRRAKYQLGKALQGSK